MKDERERALARQARLVAIVLVATTVLWIAAQWLLSFTDVAPRWAFLTDFAALGAFVWAILVTLRIWRERQG